MASAVLIWDLGFYINLPLGALTAIYLALVHIPEPEETQKPPISRAVVDLHHKLDLVGFVLFAPAVLQLLLALQFGGNDYVWGSSQVIGLFCGAGATFVVWLVWNLRMGDAAFLPASMIGRRTVWTAGLYQMLLMAAVFGAAYYLPIYFQSINGVSAMLSGVYLLPTIIPQLIIAASSGVALMKIGYVIPMAVFSTVLLSIASGLYSILGSNSPTGNWVGFQILGGIGSGAGLQLVYHQIITLIPD